MIEALSQDFRIYAVDAIYDDGRSVNSRPVKTTEDATGWLDRLFEALGLTERAQATMHSGCKPTLCATEC